MFDIWGGVWLILLLCFFPFGYKPYIYLLGLSSIFQASKFITLSSIEIPLFFVVEIFTILRLLMPYKGSGVLKFSDHRSFFLIILFTMLVVQTFFSTYFFDHIKVYSTTLSFEENYALGGIFLKFTSSNFNQLILLFIHFFTLLVIWKRRFFFKSEDFLRVILFSSIIVSVLGVIYIFDKSFYQIISKFYYNNTSYGINAIFDSRYSGTFSEPSFMGLYLAVCIVPFFLLKDFKFKIISIFLVFMSLFNFSGTFFFAVAVSIVLFYLFFFKVRLDYKVITIMFSFLFFTSFYFIFSNIFSGYLYEKSASDSNLLRSESNLNALINLFKTFFIGVGVGSERASSMFLTLCSNFGFLLIPTIFYVKSFLKHNSFLNYNDRILRLMLYIAFIGSFTSIPDFTLGFLWFLIFANATGNKI